VKIDGKLNKVGNKEKRKRTQNHEIKIEREDKKMTKANMM